MNTMTLEKLTQLFKSVGELQGTDISRVRVERAPVLWQYEDVVRQYLKPTDRVLDVGTGGGEIFLSLAPYFSEGVGIDSTPKNLEAAQSNLSRQSVGHVSMMQMEASDLQFGSDEFDVVLLRHLWIYVSEIVPILRPGGYFITQMVGQRSSLNLLDVFGWTPDSFGPNWWQTVSEVADEFRQHGCHVLAQAEYDVPYWFQDIESFIFWMKAVPWPDKIVLEKHWQNISQILETAQTERGIESNEHRGLLIVQKP
ncbi:MAG: class I SAM-dependent methyltransferase [Chloroflexota bacterium]